MLTLVIDNDRLDIPAFLRELRENEEDYILGLDIAAHTFTIPGLNYRRTVSTVDQFHELVRELTALAQQ